MVTLTIIKVSPSHRIITVITIPITNTTIAVSRYSSMSGVLFWPLLVSLVLSLIALWRAKGRWVRVRSVLMLFLYLFILIVLYFPSYLPPEPNWAGLVQLGTSFTDAVAYFSGEEAWGIIWLCSLLADFTIGFTRTRVHVLRNAGKVLDFFVYAGIVLVFLWKMGFRITM
jgi:energy-coupling factor transporter transmembrane protein EcfT